MVTYFGCTQCSLRVRVTNTAAKNLYNGVLIYVIRDTDKGYYADGEDAFDMCVFFNKQEADEDKDTAEESKAVESGVFAAG